MADLVLNINFEESRKLQHLVIETYEGSIPHLKSKQYSGPLRNANINAISTVPDNLSSLDFELIKEYLNCPDSTQVSKHQYVLNPPSLVQLPALAPLQCLFYKQRKEPMFEVDSIEICNELPKDAIHLQNAAVFGAKNTLMLSIGPGFADKTPALGTAKAYVDLKSRNHRLQLVFDYDGSPIKYHPEDQDFKKNPGMRDYALETSALKTLKQAGWKYSASEDFTYAGKTFREDLLSLIDAGIKVYTRENKPISNGDFSNLHVAYGIDWFEIRGKIKNGQEEIEIGDLIDLTQPSNQWIEVDNAVFAIPNSLHVAISQGKKDHGGIILPKRMLGTAIELAHDIDNGSVKGLSKFVNYEDVHLEIDESILSILRPYQRTGVKWLLALYENEFGGCLADDMGLGKTIQAIAYLSDSRMEGSHNLVVSPKTLLANWEREFAKFSPSTSVYVYHGIDRHIPEPLPQVLITTYGTLLHDIEKLGQMTFTNLIVDEAQFIKNPHAKNHKAIGSIDAVTTILLTGTPVENNIKEYWGLMKLANPQILEGLDPFKAKLGLSNEIGRARDLTAPFLLRRTKQDVLDDLPDKFVQTLYCNMDDSQARLYRTMLESIRHEINSRGTRFTIKSNSSVLKGLLYLQEICCHPLLLNDDLNPSHCTDSIKLDLLLELLDGRLSSGHKVVVFSRFTRMLRIIEAELAKRHATHFYLDGKTRHRMKTVDEFEQSPEGIFLVSLKAGGNGLNLVSADTVIIFDPWWNPAIEEQAQDRVFRIGQTKDVMVYKLIVANTVEEKIQALQKEKRELFDQLLDGHELPAPITIDEMVKLLEND